MAEESDDRQHFVEERKTRIDKVVEESGTQ